MAKSRDGAEAWTVPFTLCAVSLGKDEDGDEYTTCYIAAGEEQSAGMAGSGDSGRLKGAAKTYFDALNAVLDKGKKIRPWGMEGPEVIGVERKIVRDEFNVCYPVDADGDDVSERARKKKEALQKAFKRGEVSLTENRRIAVREVNGIEYVWPVREDHPS